jgi:hypothetical protein
MKMKIEAARHGRSQEAIYGMGMLWTVAKVTLKAGTCPETAEVMKVTGMRAGLGAASMRGECLGAVLGSATV